MAHRIITQLAVAGVTAVGVFGRAFAAAYRQAQASSKYAREAAAAGGSATSPSSRTASAHGMTVDEACRILNVSQPVAGKRPDVDQFIERFKTLFDKNDPKKGGSFYLQSKVLRARERLDLEMLEFEKIQESVERTKPWKPQMYKK